jgi:hypothetical protein
LTQFKQLETLRAKPAAVVREIGSKVKEREKIE